MSGEMTSVSAEPPALHGMIEKLPELVNRDAVLLRRGRHLDLDILIEIGSVPYYVSIAGGRIARLSFHRLVEPGLPQPERLVGLGEITTR